MVAESCVVAVVTHGFNRGVNYSQSESIDNMKQSIVQQEACYHQGFRNNK